MIIYIDRTIGLCDSFNNDIIDWFEDIASSYRRGMCIIRGEINSLEKIRSCVGERIQKIYTHIINRYSDFRMLASAAEKVFVLSSNSIAEVPDFLEGKVELIPLNNVFITNLYEPCYLLGENPNDCDFYKLIGQRYMYDHSLRGVRLAFHKGNGGGSTITEIFEDYILEENNPTLCLVDSDKKYGSPPPGFPDAKLGETAKQLLAAESEIRLACPNTLFEAYCIPVHEVENLIPLAVLEEITKEVPFAQDGVNALVAMKNNGYSDAILYYDFKNGPNEHATGAGVAFWNQVFIAIGQLCLAPVCSKVLIKAIKCLNAEDLKGTQMLFTFQLDPYLEPIWNTIGQKVFTWCCAAEPIRV